MMRITKHCTKRGKKKGTSNKRLHSCAKLPEAPDIGCVLIWFFHSPTELLIQYPGQRISSPMEQMTRAPAPDIFNLHLEMMNR